MIVWWTGRGHLVMSFFLGAQIATALLCWLAFQDERYFKNHSWPGVIATLVAGLLCWGVGNRLNRERSVVDVETGDEVAIKGGHHALWSLELQWWGPVLWVLAIIKVMRG